MNEQIHAAALVKGLAGLTAEQREQALTLVRGNKPAILEALQRKELPCLVSCPKFELREFPFGQA